MTAKGFAHSGILVASVLISEFSHAAYSGSHNAAISGIPSVAEVTNLFGSRSSGFVHLRPPYRPSGFQPPEIGVEIIDKLRIESDLLILPPHYRLLAKSDG